jgi:hypothetical protein
LEIAVKIFPKFDIAEARREQAGERAFDLIA